MQGDISWLPLELCFEFMKHVDSRDDLRALTRVCKSFQHEAERLLWSQTIALSSDVISDLCALIGSTPRIALYIVSLDLRATDVPADDRSNIMPTISAAIERTINLRHLAVYLSIENRGGGDPNLSMAKGVYSFRLDHSECNLRLDDALIDFLKGQSEILRLKLRIPDIDDVHDMLPLQGVLTNLRVFEVENFDFGHLFPWVLRHYPVTHLSIEDSTAKIWPDVLMSNGQIKAIKFDRRYHERLHIDFPDGEIELELLSGLWLPVVAMFSPRLKSLLAVEAHMYNSASGSEDASAHHLSSLHKACTSLRTVMIHYHHPRSRHEVRLWSWEPTGWTRDQAHEHRSLWDASVKKAMKDGARAMKFRSE